MVKDNKFNKLNPMSILELQRIFQNPGDYFKELKETILEDINSTIKMENLIQE